MLEYHFRVLLSTFQMSYSSVMSMPVDRRYRLVLEIEDEARKAKNKRDH